MLFVRYFRPALPLALAALAVSTTASSISEYENAKKKIEMVAEDKAPRGSLVTVTGSELNAWVQTEVPGVAEEGIRDPRVDLMDGRAAGSMLVDMLKLRQSRGIQDGWVMAKLMAGERPLKVTVRIQSWSGKGQVDIEKVELSGVALSGPPLDFLVRHYVQPYLPSVRFGEPFEWAHGIERLDLKPDAVRIKMKK